MRIIPSLALLWVSNCSEVWLTSDSAELAFTWPEDAQTVEVIAQLTLTPGEAPRELVSNALRMSTNPSAELAFPVHESTHRVSRLANGSANVHDLLAPCPGPAACSLSVPIQLSYSSPPDEVLVTADYILTTRRRMRVEAGEVTLDFELIGPVE